jgi:hypothetical protein
MCATAAHLIEEVLPELALRQWVLTFRFAWRKSLAASLTDPTEAPRQIQSNSGRCDDEQNRP